MGKDKAPPRYLMPGDDPKVDAVLARLRKDGEDGDPLYVDYRKLRRDRLRHEEPNAAPAAESEPVEGAPELVAPPAPEPAPPPIMTAPRPAEPQPVELPAPVARVAPGRAPSAKAARPPTTPRWLLWAAYAIAAPVVAITIGFVWSHHRATPAPTAAESVASPVTAAPLVGTATSAPSVDATAVPAPVVSATAAPTVSTPAGVLPVKPHGRRVPAREDAATDAGAPAAPTATVAPSAAPAPPPARMQPEDNREF